MQPNCEELISEARLFEVDSPLRLRRVLLKHRRSLIADDRETLLANGYMGIIASDYGDAYVAELRRKQRCFTWEGLVRNAFEMEFGERYEEFSRKRDGL